MFKFLLLSLFVQALLLPLALSSTPVVMYHGMGDTAYGSINAIKDYLEKEISGIYVTSIRVGNNTEVVFLSSYFMNLNEQVRRTSNILIYKFI